VAQAVHNTRLARRRWHRHETEAAWEDFVAAQRAKQRIIARAKQAYWRNSLHDASSSPQGIWNIARWARTKSHLPPNPPRVPTLHRGDTITSTEQEKVELLCDRFYPNTQADLEDVTDATFEDHTFQDHLSIDQLLVVSPQDIHIALHRTKPCKCPGINGIPNGFLCDMGEPLINAFTALTNQCWHAEYFPAQLRRARTITLKKPKRNPVEPGPWRPIALLSTIGKIIESVTAKRLSNAAEEYSLLPVPKWVIGHNTLQKWPLELLFEQIYTTWDAGNIATALSLNISGAFDTVNHLRLLDNLRKKGIPPG
jgi:hypothetical protein